MKKVETVAQLKALKLNIENLKAELAQCDGTTGSMHFFSGYGYNTIPKTAIPIALNCQYQKENQFAVESIPGSKMTTLHVDSELFSECVCKVLNRKMQEIYAEALVELEKEYEENLKVLAIQLNQIKEECQSMGWYNAK